jgi:hypothetical protein
MFCQWSDLGRKIVSKHRFKQTWIKQRPFGLVVAGDKPSAPTAGQRKARNRLGGAKLCVESVSVVLGGGAERIFPAGLCHQSGPFLIF